VAPGSGLGGVDGNLFRFSHEGSVLFGWMSHIHAVPPITTSNQLLYG